MARYGLLTGQDGTGYRENISVSTKSSSPKSNSSDRGSTPNRNARQPPFFNNSNNSNSNNSRVPTDASITRRVANLTFSADIPPERMADLGHLLGGGPSLPLNGSSNGGGSNRGVSNGGGSIGGGSRGRSCHGYYQGNYCKGGHSDYHSPWLNILEGKGKDLLFLIAVISMLAFYFYNVRPQPTTEPRVLGPPLLTISAPRSITKTTIAEEMRKLPWPTIYEESSVFNEFHYQTKEYDLPSQATLMTLYKDQDLHTQDLLNQFKATYNEYTTFLYLITDDLTNQTEAISTDLQTPDDLLEDVETGTFFKTRTKEPLHSRQTVSQYQDYWDRKQEQLDEIDMKLYNFYLYTVTHSASN